MRKHLFTVLAALAAGVAQAFTPQAYTNSFERGGVTYVQRGGLGTKDYVVTNVNVSAFVSGVSSVNSKTGAVVLVASDVGALPDNYASLTNNSNFKTAVEKVSPPLPNKWALADVTNGVGETVSAADVNALPDNYAQLTNNANFKSAVEKVSPPVILPTKWALANVTNSAGGNVGAVDVGALKDNYASLTNNDNFKSAVVSVSPPVVLPQKWALSNVTNENGGSVGAADVSALPDDYDSLITNENFTSAVNNETEVWKKLNKEGRIGNNLYGGLGWYYYPNYDDLSGFAYTEGSLEEERVVLLLGQGGVFTRHMYNDLSFDWIRYADVELNVVTLQDVLDEKASTNYVNSAVSSKASLADVTNVAQVVVGQNISATNQGFTNAVMQSALANGVATVSALDAKVSYANLTNAVNAVKSEFYDEQLQVNWTMRMVNGEMKLYATTNVNMSTL